MVPAWEIKFLILDLIYIEIIGILVSLLITGEALSLIAGLLIFKKLSPGWAGAANIALVLSDLVIGGYLLIKYYRFSEIPDVMEILWIMMALIATHSFRASQTLRMVKNPFCFNQPLKIANWVKLTGLITLYLFIFQK